MNSLGKVVLQRSLHTAGVASSKLASPTKNSKRLLVFLQQVADDVVKRFFGRL